MSCCINAIRARWEVTAISYLDDLLFLHPNKTYLKKATTQVVTFLR
jgi:hypothetical protein